MVIVGAFHRMALSTSSYLMSTMHFLRRSLNLHRSFTPGASLNLYKCIYISAAMQFYGVRSVYDSGAHRPFAVKLTQDHYRECSTARLYIQPHFVLVFWCEKLNKIITRLRFQSNPFVLVVLVLSNCIPPSSPSTPPSHSLARHTIIIHET